MPVWGCVIPYSAHEEGLFLFVRAWPCHMCAGSRQTAPTCEAWMFRVTPGWHADIYRTTAVFVLLSSPWQRAYRSPKVPEQYQFAQPAHGETGDKTLKAYTHARTDFFSRAMRWSTAGVKTQAYTLLEGARESNSKPAGRFILSVRNDWKLLRVTKFCRVAHDLNPCDYIIYFKRKMDFKPVKYDTRPLWRRIDMHEAFLIHFFNIDQASEEHQTSMQLRLHPSIICCKQKIMHF